MGGENLRFWRACGIEGRKTGMARSPGDHLSIRESGNNAFGYLFISVQHLNIKTMIDVQQKDSVSRICLLHSYRS